MRWLVFVIFLLASLALETGLSTLLEVGGNLTPSFVLVLAVFVAVWAPPLPAAWACLIVGVVVDLTQPFPVGPQQDVALLGPAALAFLGGGYLALQVRGMLFRDSPVTLAVMVLLLGAFVQVVLVALLTARGFAFLTGEPILGWSAVGQLMHRLGCVLYSAVLALPLGFLLVRSAPLWGFTPPASRP